MSADRVEPRTGAGGEPPAGLRRGPMLSRAISNAGIIVLYQDRDLRFVWVEGNASSWWWSRSPVGLSEHGILPAAEADHVVAVKRRCIDQGTEQRIEIRVADGGDGPRWFELWIDPHRDGSDAVVGLITTAVEITEQKHREQTLRALLREVSHRSKNLLAIIQGIASQTGRYSLSVDAFLERFRGRLQSLAESQDLVTSSNWRGARLRELVRGQVRRYVTDPGRSVRVEGIDPYLNPNAALHIGLALHELVVNSVSYGALASPTGSVELSMQQTADGAIVLVWREAVPAGSSLAESRFGSVALERVVPASLNGQAVLQLDEKRLTYQLEVPKGSFEA